MEHNLLKSYLYICMIHNYWDEELTKGTGANFQYVIVSMEQHLFVLLK